jgi:hypothetical protein
VCMCVYVYMQAALRRVVRIAQAMPPLM